MLRTIYLDNSATTPVRKEVRDIMLLCLDDNWGNPSSVHTYGREARKMMEQARRSLATLLGASPEEIFFTPCATHSNNLAILGRARFVEANGLPKHLITTEIEHPSCLGPAKYLESQGWLVTYLKGNSEGVVEAEVLKNALKKQASIVSIMWGNNEIGSIQDIDSLGAIAKESGAFFHTDAVQIPGKMSINVSKLACDSLSISAHKFYGPKGIGALYLRKGSNLLSTVFGGGQEMGLSPGTESMPNIVGIGKAAELAFFELENNAQYLTKLQGILKTKLETISHLLKFTGPQSISNRIPGHLSILVPGIEGESVVLQSDLRGLCLSSASACHKGIVQPSHVVMSCGFSEEEAKGSVRITAGKFNNESECEEAGEILVKIISSLTQSDTNSSNNHKACIAK